MRTFACGIFNPAVSNRLSQGETLKDRALGRKAILASISLLLLIGVFIPAASAQDGPPPSFAPWQLDRLVSRIALYPDPLLAQVLAAATFPDQIPEAARWADEHHYLSGPDLANAIQDDQVPWDPSVQALLPFPSVLDMMASNFSWTSDLGNAFLAQQQDVMDAVQREREKAERFGYLRSNSQVIVANGPYITIIPANAAYCPIPVYDPNVVYAPPPRGYFVGNAIRFGFFVNIGNAFRPWGWGYSRFDWRSRVVFVNNSPWRRGWGNRFAYEHPYADLRRFDRRERFEDRHERRERSEDERRAAFEGRERHEEHERERDHDRERERDHDRERDRDHERRDHDLDRDRDR
jgi:hypothetical protein